MQAVLNAWATYQDAKIAEHETTVPDVNFPTWLEAFTTKQTAWWAFVHLAEDANVAWYAMPSIFPPSEL